MRWGGGGGAGAGGLSCCPVVLGGRSGAGFGVFGGLLMLLSHRPSDRPGQTSRDHPNHHHEQKWGWVQEMYAFTISLWRVGVKHVDLHLQLMAQPPWDSKMQVCVALVLSARVWRGVGVKDQRAGGFRLDWSCFFLRFVGAHRCSFLPCTTHIHPPPPPPYTNAAVGWQAVLHLSLHLRQRL